MALALGHYRPEKPSNRRGGKPLGILSLNNSQLRPKNHASINIGIQKGGRLVSLILTPRRQLPPFKRESGSGGSLTFRRVPRNSHSSMAKKLCFLLSFRRHGRPLSVTSHLVGTAKFKQ